VARGARPFVGAGSSSSSSSSTSFVLAAVLLARLESSRVGAAGVAGALPSEVRRLPAPAPEVRRLSAPPCSGASWS